MAFRTIKKSMEILKELDNGTSLTEYYLRVLAKTGQIMVLNVGSKYLINIKSLFEFLHIENEEV